MNTLDNIDLKILTILQKDSRRSISEIAETLGLSRPTVRKRIKKMIEAGVIKRFTVLVDDKLIKGVKVLYRFKSEAVDKILNHLKERDEFIEVYMTSGERNIVGLAIYRDIETFKDAMDTFINNGFSFEADIIVKEVKRREDYIPVLRFRLTCDYCGKIIEGAPFKYTLYNRDFYFCCNTCLNNFRRMREI